MLYLVDCLYWSCFKKMKQQTKPTLPNTKKSAALIQSSDSLIAITLKMKKKKKLGKGNIYSSKLSTKYMKSGIGGKAP